MSDGVSKQQTESKKPPFKATLIPVEIWVENDVGDEYCLYEVGMTEDELCRLSSLRLWLGGNSRNIRLGELAGLLAGRHEEGMRAFWGIANGMRSKWVDVRPPSMLMRTYEVYTATPDKEGKVHRLATFKATSQEFAGLYEAAITGANSRHYDTAGSLTYGEFLTAASGRRLLERVREGNLPYGEIYRHDLVKIVHPVDDARFTTNVVEELRKRGIDFALSVKIEPEPKEPK